MRVLASAHEKDYSVGGRFSLIVCATWSIKNSQPDYIRILGLSVGSCLGL
jgi:hypothetical protein